MIFDEFRFDCCVSLLRGCWFLFSVVVGFCTIDDFFMIGLDDGF